MRCDSYHSHRPTRHCPRPLRTSLRYDQTNRHFPLAAPVRPRGARSPAIADAAFSEAPVQPRLLADFRAIHVAHVVHPRCAHAGYFILHAESTLSPGHSSPDETASSLGKLLSHPRRLRSTRSSGFAKSQVVHRCRPKMAKFIQTDAGTAISSCPMADSGWRVSESSRLLLCSVCCLGTKMSGRGGPPFFVPLFSYAHHCGAYH